MARVAPPGDAFTALYDAAYGPVVAQVYALTGDLGEAQDVAQTAFLRLWVRWRRVSVYDDPAAWVRRVAHNLAISRWRKTRTARSARLRDAAMAESGEPAVESVLLVSALRQLPPAQRRALVLHHMAGFSITEVADLEKATTAAVKMRLFHGRRALARLLAGSAADEDQKVHHG